jgi:hypothetical protein
MKKLIDKLQAAKLLDIPVKTLELWVSKKFGPKAIWTGKILRFDKAEVEAFAQKLTLKDDSTKPTTRKKKMTAVHRDSTAT